MWRGVVQFPRFLFLKEHVRSWIEQSLAQIRQANTSEINWTLRLNKRILDCAGKA